MKFVPKNPNVRGEEMGSRLRHGAGSECQVSAILPCGWKQWCEVLVDSRCHGGRTVVGQAPLIARNISNGVELGAGLDNVVHGVANC